MSNSSLPTKAQIRKHFVESVQNRPNNLRYDKSQGLNDLVEQAEAQSRKRRRNERKTKVFSTTFDVPSSQTFRRKGISSGDVGAAAAAAAAAHYKSKGTRVTVVKTTAADTLLAAAEMPTLAALVALGISNMYGLGYWERRICFVVCAVSVALGRWWMETNSDSDSDSNSNSNSNKNSRHQVTRFQELCAMPLAWSIAVYWCLHVNFFIRSLLAFIAFAVRYTIEVGRQREKERQSTRPV